ncbi:S-adenosyl-L-methionine-dependent methyltransferase [Cercophora newfieldiana]|uniref:S-adenosyl-L-methionine-dependent methyltransferase n=1 Tax=Cercophora newfieldiana TaxID=92897 RepID=A0AA40CSD7_9PEZI|nr:S-adenosyl-L-methionine-dependent methyltransferase [Cercophora newfieldiana]
MKHAMMLELTDGKLFFALIGDYPQKVIDLATGTGIWAIDYTSRAPSCRLVLGVDFTPIQPDWVPPNLKFIVDDVEDEWLNGSNYDFVHMRQVTLLLKQPEKVLLSHSFRHMKPGAWIEFGGMTYCDDSSTPHDYKVQGMLDASAEAFKKFGNDFRIANDLEPRLAAAGFTKISVKKLKVPIGTWPKDKKLRLIGLYFISILEALFRAIGGRPLIAAGMDPVEIEVFLAGVRKDLKNTNYHSYMEYIFWTAQKPK